jgi:hypothetical protein
MNGSLTDSSVYLFSSQLQQSLYDDETWDNYVAQDPPVLAAINGLTYTSKDMEIIFTRGPNTTVMFYLSTLVEGTNGQTSVHRTFPGTYKNSINYNPAERGWFKNAPVDGVFLYGPYRVLLLSHYTTHVLIN